MSAVPNRTLSIWYVTAYDMPGGQSSRTYDYATELAEMGHRVTMLTSSFSHFTHQERLGPDESWREEWFGKVRVIWLKTIPYERNNWKRAANMLSNAWKAVRVGSSLEESPDVIFGPSVPLFTGLAASWLAKRRKCAFCFEVRDIWPQALIDLGHLPEHHPVTWFFKRIESTLYHRASHIIAALPFAHTHISRFGIPRDKITWIPNGTNFRRFSGYGSYDGGHPDSLSAMYIGGFSKTHDVKTIVRAAQMVQAAGCNISFMIIGEGGERNSIFELARELNVTNIEFRPIVPKDEVVHLMARADVLLACVKDTPVYQFGINSNKLFDYLAAGRPVIFAGKSPNDPIREANAGITIPPEDPAALCNALRTILTMPPERRADLGRNGKHHALMVYDTRVLAKKLEKVLLQISDSRNG